MKTPMAPNIALAIIAFTAVAAVALRAAARRPGPQGVPGTKPAPATVTADDRQRRLAAAVGTHDGTGHDTARPSALPGRPASAVERVQPIFHELHADGRNALCAVCDSQYGSA
jgi:hypothetical protein